jgi:hypothetical protein
MLKETIFNPLQSIENLCLWCMQRSRRQRGTSRTTCLLCRILVQRPSPSGQPWQLVEAMLGKARGLFLLFRPYALMQCMWKKWFRRSYITTDRWDFSRSRGLLSLVTPGRCCFFQSGMLISALHLVTLSTSFRTSVRLLTPPKVGRTECTLYPLNSEGS